MPPIKVKHIVSFSTEDKNHPAENLLKDDQYRKWKSAPAGEKSASIVLQFEKAEKIHAVDIGNEGSAFVEILVGRSAKKDDFQVLLVASSFMSPSESKSGSNLNRVRMFTSDKLSKTVVGEKWDQVKVVCTQPFNKNLQYGLSFVKFHSVPDGTSSSTPSNTATKQSTLKFGSFVVKQEDPADILGPGSLFAKQKDKGTTPPLKGAAAVRAASNLAEASLQKQKVGDLGRRTPSQRATPVVPKRHAEEGDVVPSSRVKAETPPSRERNSKKSDESQQKTKGLDKAESTRKQQKSPAAVEQARKTDAPLSAKKNSRPSSPPPKRQKRESAAGKDTPFERLMDGVVFTLSGFQNPYRSQLREQGLAMGAKYRPDWDNACTHLVCAFVNTPKFLQVQGKDGKIVGKEWILDCHKKRKLLPWKQYRLGGSGGSDDNETESTDDDDYEESNNSARKGVSSTPKAPTPKKPVNSPGRASAPKLFGTTSTKAAADEDDYGGSTDVDSDREAGEAESSDTEDEIRRVLAGQGKAAGQASKDRDSDEVYDADTDVDEPHDEAPNGKVDTSHLELPKLPNLFRGKGFYLYGTFDARLRRLLVRYITAFDGKVEDYMGDKISFVITQSDWDDQFDEALEENPSLSFVKPRWIFACSDKRRLVPHQPFSVMPSDPEDD